MKESLVVFILIILALAGGLESASEKNVGIIKGRVMGPENRLIIDVQIRCMRERKFGEDGGEGNTSYSFGMDSDHVTKSNKNGEYIFKNLPSGNYIMSAFPKDFARVIEKDVNVKPTNFTWVDFRLEKTSEIGGRVSTLDGAPLEGVEITASIENDFWSYSDRVRDYTTDDNGEFRIKGMSTYVYEMSFTKKGFVHTYLKFAPLSAGVGVMVKMQKTPVLTGKVVDISSKKSVRDFSIIVGGLGTVYDSSKHYFIMISPNSAFQVSAEESLDLSKIKPKIRIESLENWTVDFWGPSLSELFSFSGLKDGVFILSDLQPQTTDVTIIAEGFAYSIIRDVKLTAETTIDLGIIELGPGALLSLKVLSDETQKGIPGAEVAIKDTEHSDFESIGSYLGEDVIGHTDDSGICLMAGLPIGSWKMMISHNDYEEYVLEISVKNHEKIEKTVVLNLKKGNDKGTGNNDQ